MFPPASSGINRNYFPHIRDDKNGSKKVYFQSSKKKSIVPGLQLVSAKLEL